MGSSSIFFLFSYFLALSVPFQVESSKITNPQITVMGTVYCDICSNNTFSTHSYFLPGVEVRIDCEFKAKSPRISEEISFTANRTTNKHGIYKLQIPSVDGVQCARDKAIGNFCRATLLGNKASSCNVPGHKTTTDEISIKSKQKNLCVYSLSALNYRPSKPDINLCGN